MMKRVVGLTGTPAPNGLIDLWSQMYLLDRGERLFNTEKPISARISVTEPLFIITSYKIVVNSGYTRKSLISVFP